MAIPLLPETLAFAVNQDLAYDLRGDGELIFVTRLPKASRKTMKLLVWRTWKSSNNMCNKTLNHSWMPVYLVFWVRKNITEFCNI